VKCLIAAITAGSFLVVPCIPAQSQKTPNDAPTPLIDSVQRAELYKAYCAVCHGEDAKGNGPMTKSLKSLPPDLTRLFARNGGVFRWCGCEG